MAYYRTAYRADPGRTVAEHVGSECIRNDPLAADDNQAFIDYSDEMARDYPDKRIEFVRAVAENDMVTLHTHQTWPGNQQYVTMNFVRFDDDGKIVEHRDSNPVDPTRKQKR